MLYSSAEAAPARLAALLRTTHAAGPLTSERLEALLAPPALGDGRKPGAVRDNLQLALDLGLVRSSAGHPPLFQLAGTAPANEDWLKEVGRRLLGNGLPVVDPQAPHEYYQFAKLVAWFLDQPLSRAPALAQVRERWDQVAEPAFRPLDQSLFEQFLAWATALGVLHRLNVGRQQPISFLVVNPSPLLRRHLADFMAPGTPQSAPDWLRALGEHFPVFDRGWIRQRVRPIEDQILTPTLSFAVCQLADEGAITLEDRKDAPRLRLRIGRFEQQFTRITLAAEGVP